MTSEGAVMTIASSLCSMKRTTNVVISSSSCNAEQSRHEQLQHLRCRTFEYNGRVYLHNDRHQCSREEIFHSGWSEGAAEGARDMQVRAYKVGVVDYVPPRAMDPMIATAIRNSMLGRHRRMER